MKVIYALIPYTYVVSEIVVIRKQGVIANADVAKLYGVGAWEVDFRDNKY